MTTETTSCCQRLIDDHRETEVLLARMQEIIETQGELPNLAKLFETLKQALDLHFACEEHGLFPVLNAYRTMILMELEHDDLLEKETAFATSLQASIESGRVQPDLKDTFAAWQERLLAHIVEEDRGIFPMADKMLEPEERQLVTRKIDELIVLARKDVSQTPALNRPTPGFERKQLSLNEAPAKPIAFDRRFDVDHASLSHIQLQAGQKLARHWAAENQCLIVISGNVSFITDTESLPLAPGTQLNIEPRFLFALEAETDAHLLLFKVWAKPHFVRT